MNGLGFSTIEWHSVRMAPWIVGTAVIDADFSGPIGTRNELGTVVRSLQAAAEPGDRSELVRAIAQDLLDDPAEGPLETPEAVSDWQSQLRWILQVVDDKSPTGHARDLRAWLQEIAADVAEASRDHARSTGPRVSKREQEILDELAALLAD